jgi:hypothetical protein
MKLAKLMAIVTLALLAVSGASAQSLGDYARTARKSKPAIGTATRHYDNDNLPTNEHLSVVGPPATNDSNGAQQAGGASAVAAAKAAAGAPGAAPTSNVDRQKAADEWKSKLERQKDKIDALNHELDLEQREYRLRAATYYSDAGTRLRDAAQFDKQDTQYKTDVESKQKAIDAARKEYEDLQEQARKAGVANKEKDDK